MSVYGPFDSADDARPIIDLAIAAGSRHVVLSPLRPGPETP